MWSGFIPSKPFYPASKYLVKIDNFFSMLPFFCVFPLSIATFYSALLAGLSKLSKDSVASAHLFLAELALIEALPMEVER
jgi:hypothetical protein